MMNKKEIKHFVESLEKTGIEHKDAIKKLAILIEKEVPEEKDLEYYYQQKIGGE